MTHIDRRTMSSADASLKLPFQQYGNIRKIYGDEFVAYVLSVEDLAVLDGVADTATDEQIGVIVILWQIYLSNRRGTYTPQAGAVTHLIKIRVDDVDAQFERARSHGAQVLQEPADHEYGVRECTVADPAGHHWQFMQTTRDVAPQEWGGAGTGW